MFTQNWHNFVHRRDKNDRTYLIHIPQELLHLAGFNQSFPPCRGGFLESILACDHSLQPLLNARAIVVMLGEQIFGELFQVVDATQLSFEGLLESFVFAEESFNS